MRSGRVITKRLLSTAHARCLCNSTIMEPERVRAAAAFSLPKLDVAKSGTLARASTGTEGTGCRIDGINRHCDLDPVSFVVQGAAGCAGRVLQGIAQFSLGRFPGGLIHPSATRGTAVRGRQDSVCVLQLRPPAGGRTHRLESFAGEEQTMAVDRRWACLA